MEIAVKSRYTATMQQSEDLADTIENPRVLAIGGGDLADALVARATRYYQTQVVGWLKRRPSKSSKFSKLRLKARVTEGVPNTMKPNAIWLFELSPFAITKAIKSLRKGVNLVVIQASDQQESGLQMLKLACERMQIPMLGPETSGIVACEMGKIGGIMHQEFVRGEVSIIARSGSMLYECGRVMKDRGIGVRFAIDLGASHNGSGSISYWVRVLQEDDLTKRVLILDEAGFRLKPDDIRQMSECSKPIGCLVYPKTTFMKQLNNGMMAVSSPPISTSLSDRLRLQIETVDGGIGKLHRLSVAGVPVYRNRSMKPLT
jgi:succinyl-CoA synthetase alpha subunit